jgi:hypothetical protein
VEVIVVVVGELGEHERVVPRAAGQCGGAGADLDGDVAAAVDRVLAVAPVE